MVAEGRRRRPRMRMLGLRRVVVLDGAAVGGDILCKGQNGLNGGMGVCWGDGGGRVGRGGCVRGLIRVVRLSTRELWACSAEKKRGQKGELPLIAALRWVGGRPCL